MGLDRLQDPFLVQGRIVEAGAELIGANHPLWLKLALEFDLALSVLTQEDRFGLLDVPIIIDNKTLSTAEAKELFDAMTLVHNWLSELAEEIPEPAKPWNAKNAVLLDGETVGLWLNKRSSISELAKKAVKFDLENDQTVPIDQMSLLGLLAMIKGGGGKTFWEDVEVYRCSNGNQALAFALVNAIKTKGGTVEMNSVVNTITSEGHRVKIETQSGERSYDWVVVAVPLAALKADSQNRITFSPPSLVKALKELQFGPALKHLSAVSNRFWLAVKKAPTGFSTSLGMFWEGTDNQAAVNESEQFDLSIFAGGPVRNPHQPWLAKISEIYPNYKEFLIKDQTFDWLLEPFIECGYSCPAPTQVTGILQHVNTSCNDTRVVFAGEYTAPDFFGFMEGALVSGKRAATLIATPLR
jgi:monoamine oxidase